LCDAVWCTCSGVHVVWCGVMLCDAVWCGVVWCGVVHAVWCTCSAQTKYTCSAPCPVHIRRCSAAHMSARQKTWQKHARTHAGRHTHCCSALHPALASASTMWRKEDGACGTCLCIPQPRTRHPMPCTHLCQHCVVAHAVLHNRRKQLAPRQHLQRRAARHLRKLAQHQGHAVLTHGQRAHHLQERHTHLGGCGVCVYVCPCPQFCAFVCVRACGEKGFGCMARTGSEARSG